MPTDGVVALRKLRDHGYRLWDISQVDGLMPRAGHDIILHTSYANYRRKETPSAESFVKDLDLNMQQVRARLMNIRAKKTRPVLINFTTAEALIHLDLVESAMDIVYIEDFERPEELSWLDKYVENEILKLKRKSRKKAFDNPRPSNRIRHYIALVKERGESCYKPLFPQYFES